MSIEQYEKIFKEELKELKDAIHEIRKRLFIDNGTKSMQTVQNEIRLWQANHDEQQTKHDNKQATHDSQQADHDNRQVYNDNHRFQQNLKDLSFLEWLMTNWKSISAFVFLVVWVVTQVYPGKGLNAEQQQEIKGLLKTVIVDTRPKE